MDFFIGLLCGVVLIAFGIGSFYLGSRHERNRPAQARPPDKTADDHDLEKQREQAKKFHTGFQTLMNYDLGTALGRKES